jgi:hypothetical protein
VGAVSMVVVAFAGCGGDTTGSARSADAGAGGSDASAGGAGARAAGGAAAGGAASGGAGGRGGVAALGGAGGASCACPPTLCAPGYRSVVAPGACCATCQACGTVSCPNVPACSSGERPVTPPGQCCPTSCGPVAGGGGTDASAATDSGTFRPCGAPGDGAALPCQGTSTSTLHGVSARLLPTRCSFTVSEALAGVDVPYDVVVDSQNTAIVPAPLDAGGCDTPNASGLIPFVDVAGGGQSYCVCDTGLCAPPSRAPITLAAGCYAGTAHWQGVNWAGPSDTGNPKGAAFPPGSYVVRLRHAGQLPRDAGTRGFEVDATVVVRITP